MKKKVPRSFGEKLKYAREHFGMSRNELAIRAQITQLCRLTFFDLTFFCGRSQHSGIRKSGSNR